MDRWSPYMVRPEQGLRAHAATGIVPKAYGRFSL